ncbi:N-acetylmuramoyl-L-alanine amidase [bacterium]|nr:N-acetylmuramoyl-L-alanine amidase [bacterium]
MLKIPSGKVASPATKVRRTPKSLRVIIDAGHGGKDRGAVWGGVRESDLNLKVARRVIQSGNQIFRDTVRNKSPKAFFKIRKIGV